MARKKNHSSNANKKPIEQYEHKDKTRLNKPTVELVDAHADNWGQRKESISTTHTSIYSFYGQVIIMAEIELAEENETFTTSDWIGQEVNGDERYYNSNLSRNSYKKWWHNR